MSLIAGITGQPAELLDGATVPNGKPLQVDSVTEKTAGRGVSIQGRTNGTPIEAGKVGEVKVAPLTNGTLSLSGTDYAVASINLTAGNWVVYCKAMITTGGTSTLYRDVSLTTSSTAQDLTTLTRDSGVTYNAHINAMTYYVDSGIPVTIYLIAQAGFTGTPPIFTAGGSNLWAIRIA